MKSLRVTFLLPGTGIVPVGGFKIVYEYANRLSQRGHHVAVVHTAARAIDRTGVKKLRSAGVYAFRKLTGRFKPTSWFQIEPSVKLMWVPSLANRYIPDGDVFIATSWQTAEWALGYSLQKGRGFYLVQGLETWDAPEERVYATWKLPLQKIVIARWLEKIVDSRGQKAVYIPNGLDFDVYKITTPSAERDPHSVAMLYHDYVWKGSRDGLDALLRVKEEIPDLRVTLFGVPARPPDLPEWFGYQQRASQRVLLAVYNKSAIFVSPSISEGWGLTATEAMMCGCAVAATDIGGHQEFAIHERTALLSPASDSARLADNIMRLIRDPALRIRIAENGHEFVQQFTWEKAVTALESLLLAKSIREADPGQIEVPTDRFL